MRGKIKKAYAIKPKYYLAKMFSSKTRIACFCLAVFLSLSGFLLWSYGKSRATSVTFTSSGTWTVPSYVNSATFEAWGGGGAGGGSTANSTGGGGGAGGQYALKTYTVSSGEVYTVNVATSTSGTTGNGSAGGDSSVVSPGSATVVLAKGGAGGTANGGAGGTGGTAGGVGDVVRSGGSGAAGSGTSSGGGGGGAGSSSNGGNASGAVQGTGGLSNGGDGGAGFSTSGNSNGAGGSLYGGGGGGGARKNANATGGAGSNGYVVITYSLVPYTYNQTSYQWFNNANSLTPGSAIGSQNTPTTLSSTGQQFRLRQLVKTNRPLASSRNLTDSTVDNAASFRGYHSSLKIASDGYARIAEDDSTDLFFIQCTNTSCSTNNITTLDTPSSVDWESMVLGSDGFARIAYHDASSTAAVKFIQCTNASCSSFNSSIVDSGTLMGERPALTLGGDGFARIAYIDGNTTNLKFAQCTNSSCSAANITTISTSSTNIDFPQIAIGSDGYPRIAYSTSAFPVGIDYIKCTNAACSTSTSNAVENDNNIIGYTSMVLGSNGFAKITYAEQTTNYLRLAQCNDDACTTSNLSTISSDEFDYSSISLDSKGYPVIAYQSQSTSGIYVYSCHDTTCQSSSTQSYTNSGTIGQSISLALDSNDLLMASTYNSTGIGSLDLVYENARSGLFNEQYADLSTYGVCSSVPSGNWSNIPSSATTGGLSFYDNSSAINFNSIATTASDPTESGQTVTAENYVESNGFYNSVDFGGTSDGMWDLSLFDNGAPANKTYCLRAVKADGTPLDTYTNYPTVTTSSGNASSSSPTLLSPTSGATNQSTSPLFQLRASDAENDYLRYKIVIYNSDCSTNPQTFDQTATQSGWIFQDTQNQTAYTGSSALSGSTIAKFGSANLSANTQYCWKAAAIDPGGSNTWGPYSATQLFTTGATNAGGVTVQGGGTVRGGGIVR